MDIDRPAELRRIASHLLAESRAANANPTILDRELAAHVVPIVRLIVDAGVERNAPRILRHAAILAGRIPNTSKKLAESPAKVRFARLDTSNGVQCLTLWRVFLLPMARDSAKAVRADLAVDDMMRVVGTTNPNPPRLRKQHAAIMNNALPFMERHNTLVKQIAAAPAASRQGLIAERDENYAKLKPLHAKLRDVEAKLRPRVVVRAWEAMTEAEQSDALTNRAKCWAWACERYAEIITNATDDPRKMQNGNAAKEVTAAKPMSAPEVAVLRALMKVSPMPLKNVEIEAETRNEVSLRSLPRVLKSLSDRKYVEKPGKRGGTAITEAGIDALKKKR